MHRQHASVAGTRAHARGACALIAFATSVLACALGPNTVHADPALRTQMDLRGNFVLFGATLAQDCASGVPAPVVGTIGNCPDDNLAAPDIYWRADDPSPGSARADANISSDDARATAVLELPAGAQVAYARLYWGGLLPTDSPDMQVQLQRVEDSLDETVTADDTTSLAQSGTTDFFYQGTADVTDLVKAHGAGPYRIAGVASDLTNAQTGGVAAWYMVVFYELAGQPSRNLAIFDGLEYVDLLTQANATLSGFLVPPTGFDATLGVVAYEGEDQFTGDALSFNGTALSDALNPVDNFFNATRSRMGAPVSNAGDLPQFSGQPGSYSNVDIDVVDVSARVHGGDSSATIAASSSLDIFVLSAFVTSISTLRPDFSTTSKSVVDLNGGLAVPGDVLEYRIVAENTGSDDAVNVRLHDELPAGVTFVPGSLRIESGPGSGTKSDASGDDQAEYDKASRTVSARLGTSADASMGGGLAIGESSELRFQVTIDADTRGAISNQGFIDAAGRQGAPDDETATDGDAIASGQDPTTITVEECEDDSQCMPPTPFCDISASPRKCVGCATSGQCDDPDKPDCDTSTGTCVCSAGPGKCTPESDSDGDGISDDGEKMLGTDPHDADTDDDGVIDGDELAPAEDSDGDGVIKALDVDSDNDGLLDGTESGLGCDNPQTDTSAGHCRPDADMGATKTSPVNADTDGGGVRDGSEDVNLNGVVDGDETDPTAGHGDDDASLSDSDGDGLSDALENAIGTGVNDKDSDDDGLLDGDEANPTDDNDGDGTIDALDSDSDGDGLLDGTELGRGCDDLDTDKSKMSCVPDADMGATVTSPINPDTDFGGIVDGKEDRNGNGIIDQNETDPNDPDDDVECQADDDCGASDSGQICISGACAPGCRGENGNGCPDGQRCTSGDTSAGTCEDLVTTHFGGGGCKCGVSPLDRESLPALLLVALSLLLVGRRRRGTGRVRR